jgi:hypothetical protein
VSLFGIAEAAVYQAERARRDQESADDLCDAHGRIPKKKAKRSVG